VKLKYWTERYCISREYLTVIHEYVNVVKLTCMQLDLKIMKRKKAAKNLKGSLSVYEGTSVSGFSG